MKFRKTIIVILTLCLILALPIAASAEERVKIPDSKLKNALRELCGKGLNEEMMPSELAALTGDIDLSDKGITNASGIQHLTGASNIDLSYNSIEKFPSKAVALTGLEGLDLSFNEIYQVPREVAVIPNLTALNLSANKMKMLPKEIGEMPTLMYLDISANRFTDFPTALHDLTLTDFNCDYNFFDLEEGSRNRKDIDAMNVSGELLAFRQLIELPAITYSTLGSKFVVEWRGLDDIPFYDGTTAVVSGYSVLVNGKFKQSTGPAKRSIQVDAVPGESYKFSVSPSYVVDSFEDFDIRSYTTIRDAKLGTSGPSLRANAEPVLYENPYATPAPTPTPTPTPTPEITPEPTPEPTPNMSSEPEPSAVPTASRGLFGTSMLMTIVLLAVILLLIIVITVLLVVVLRNKNIKGKE